LKKHFGSLKFACQSFATSSIIFMSQNNDFFGVPDLIRIHDFDAKVGRSHSGHAAIGAGEISHLSGKTRSNFFCGLRPQQTELMRAAIFPTDTDKMMMSRMQSRAN